MTHGRQTLHAITVISITAPSVHVSTNAGDINMKKRKTD